MSTKPQTDEIAAVAETPEPPPETIWDECQPPEIIKIRNSRGTVDEYEIREMKGPELSSWMAIWTRYSAKAIGSAATKDIIESNGTPDPDVYAELISRCLHKGEHRVPKAMIERWGASLLSYLFARCQDKNGQTAKAEKREGKS